MKILFLDMDGVMNHHGFSVMRNREVENSDPFANSDPNEDSRQLSLRKRMFYWIDPICASNLLYILEKDEEIRLVISSTWRAHFSIEEFEFMLGAFGIPKGSVIGTTDHRREHPLCDRGDLCILWAVQNKVPRTRFVCVDDDSDFQNCKSRLVQTSHLDGLTFSKAEQILKKFGHKSGVGNYFGRSG